MDKTQKITMLASIILVGFVFGVFFHYILGFYLKAPAPFNNFLYPPHAFLCDFKGAFPYIKDFKPYNSVSMWVIYFPLTYIITIPFAFIKNLFLSYLVYISGFLAYFTFMNIKSFKCENLTKLQNFQNIFIITLMSYPFLSLLDKGNFDMFLFILLGFFAYTFNAGKYKPAAILLAVANAIKPFSILFLILFLIKKKYKECFLSIFLSAILVIGGFMIFPDNFFSQIINLLKTLTLFKMTYAVVNTNDYGMGYASSLFMVLKLIFCKITATPIIQPINLVQIYDKLSFLITLITIFFVCREKTFWKQLTLLVCNFLLLPYVTYDYKLVFLFIPVWLFVNSEEKTRFDLIYLILFALLFIPKNIVITLPELSNTATTWFSLSMVINPLIMTFLSLLIIYEQFYGKKEKKSL